MEKIIINVDEKEYSAIVSNEDSDIIIDDKKHKIEKLKRIGASVYSLSVDNHLLIVDIQDKKNDIMQIYTDGFMFDAEVTNETKRLIRKYLKESGAGDGSGYAQIKAPMPGMVIKVNVSVGDEVKKGDKIIIIEAMKMENAVAAPIAGIIKTINAVENKSVEKEELLIEIESNNNKQQATNG
jgi:biotin carboxyl carrier protein